MYLLKYCKWIWIILALWVVGGLLLFYNPKTQYNNEIVLAAPRDIAPGPKDPYYISSIGMVWEPLIGVDANGQIAGVLASGWKGQNDNKDWVISLRQNVTFHDGSPFNADAVLKNVERWQNMKTKPSPFYTFNYKALYPGLTQIEKIDDYTVVFHLDKPDPVFPEHLINFSSAMFNPNSYDMTTGDFINTDIGTGPFKIVDRQTNQYVVLQRNDQYYGEKAKSQFIRIRTIPSAETRYAALKAEEIYGVVDIGAMTPALSLELLGDSRFAMSKNRNTLNQVLTVNESRWPFSDSRMVKALSLAVDRDILLQQYFSGQAQPNINILNSLNPFSIDLPITYDMEKAKELSAEVLQGKRVQAKLLIPQYGLNRYSYKEVAQYLQYLYKELGIDISIVILDGSAFSKLSSQGNYDLSLGTMGLANYAPETIFNTYLADKGRMNTLYKVGYHDDEASMLLKKLDGLSTIEERIPVYDRLQVIGIEHPPTIILGSDLNALIYNQAKIKGYNALTYGVSLQTIEWR